MELYHSPGFVNEKRKFAEWLCLPNDNDMGGKGKGLREPATFSQLAAELGVSREVLFKWQRDPNFIVMKHTIKKQITLDLEDEFLHRMTIALLNPGSNYDRIFMVWERYAKPALQDEKERGEWDKFLPQISNDIHRRKTIYTQAVYKIRLLPVEQREALLNILDELAKAEDEGQSIEPESFSPRRIHTGDDDEEPAQAEAQLPALPAPADTTSDTTDTTPRYDPSRGVRKPIRKPKR
jgi:hypothetical protein